MSELNTVVVGKRWDIIYVNFYNYINVQKYWNTIDLFPQKIPTQLQLKTQQWYLVGLNKHYFKKWLNTYVWFEKTLKSPVTQTSQKNSNMTQTELMIKIKERRYCSYCTLGSRGPSCPGEANETFRLLGCQVDCIFLMPSQAISKMMLYRTIWMDTFHVTLVDCFQHDKNTSQGQILSSWKYQIQRQGFEITVKSPLSFTTAH